jgi:hypothetical protein
LPESATRKGALDDVGAKLKGGRDPPVDRGRTRRWRLKRTSDRKPPMKAYPNLAKDDLDALVAYVASLKK